MFMFEENVFKFLFNYGNQNTLIFFKFLISLEEGPFFRENENILHKTVC